MTTVRTDADASMDFETRSAAGHVWDEARRRWAALDGASQGRKGLSVVGAAAYAEHPTTRVLTLAYQLPGVPKRWWRPGLPNPQDLFDYLAAGGTIEAHNMMFERLIWACVCVPLYGWPPLEQWQYQLRCSMAKARVNSLPGALGSLSDVLRLPVPKDKDGKRLLDKFSTPRNPTKPDPRLWIEPHEDPEDFAKLEAYCGTDIDAEHGASTHPSMRPMSADELLFWLVDQEINMRGVGIDRPAVRDCLAILRQALAKYGDECRALTGFDPTQLQALRGWLSARGVHLDKMDEEALDEALKTPLPDDCRRVLEIRQLIGSASVKKLYAMENQACADGRLRNLIVHHGARTGRPTGEGPQPLNLPKAGPKLFWCAGCGAPFGAHHLACPWCLKVRGPGNPRPWSADAVDTVLSVIASRDLATVEWFFGDALLCISGCLRGLFVARPGYDLIASDFSSIEAVVIAQLAGEQWRIEAFHDNKPIYLLSASKITGRSLEEYLAYYEAHGEHHPDRGKIGKVNELANGFGGWIGSARAFGFEGTDDEAKANILAWRAASPAIVELWGGQFRGAPWDPSSYAERYGFEGAAVNALSAPGVVFDCRGIKFELRDHSPTSLGRLVITLLSGREMVYHSPMLSQATRKHSRPSEMAIHYMTWNTNPKYGPMGWVAMNTYGGRLTENIVQATAHDILRFAILNLRAAGYPTVLHVYDEVLAEIPAGTGSIEEFERIMAIMPPWAAGWPIRASGGWRGRRYRKG